MSHQKLILPHEIRLREKGNKSQTLIEERVEGAGETYLVPWLDGYLYYSPLQGTVMVLDEFASATVRKYFRKDRLSLEEQTLVDGLQQRGVLQVSPMPQGVSSRAADKRWAPTSATFSTTQRCTLRCRYCYAEGGRTDDLDIPLPIASAAIDIVIKNAMEQATTPSISFLGEGEATLSWTQFHDIIEYFKQQCQSYGLSPNVSLSTNGVFPSSRLDYIAENCTNVTFSLDGIRDVHDENRILPNGRGSFDLIVKNMKGLEARGKAYDIRSTVTNAGVTTLSEFVQFVGEQLLCKQVHLEPVFDATVVTRLVEDIAQPEGARFVEAFRQARRVAASYGIELHYSGSDPKLREKFCGAGDADNFLVTTRGIVTACTEVLQPWDPRAKLFQYGRWSEERGEFGFDQQAIEGLGALNVHRMPKCQGCIAKYHCAGDCYAKTSALYGDPAAAQYTDRCHIARELLKDNLILQAITQRVEGSATRCSGGEAVGQLGN